MEATVNAERNVIQLAGKTIEVFMLPNGEYIYSQESAAKAVGKDRTDAGKYIRSRKNEALTGGTEDSTTTSKTLQDKGLTGGRLVKVGRTRVAAITDVEVAAYWQWKADNGNVEAKALMAALATEALHKRANEAFGVKVTSEQLEQRTNSIRHELLAKYNQVNFEFLCIPFKDLTPEEEALQDKLFAEQQELDAQLTKEEIVANIPEWREYSEKARLIRLQRQEERQPQWLTDFNRAIANM